MGACQYVPQIGVLLSSDFRDIWVQAGLPAAVAEPSSELGQVQGVVVEVPFIEPFEPTASADLGEIGGERVVIQLRPGDQKNLGVHVPHDLAPYRCPPTLAGASARVRHSRSTLATTTRPASPNAVRIDSGWNWTAHRLATGSSIAITTSRWPSAPPRSAVPPGPAVTAVTANPPLTWSGVAKSE